MDEQQVEEKPLFVRSDTGAVPVRSTIMSSKEACFDMYNRWWKRTIISLTVLITLSFFVALTTWGWYASNGNVQTFTGGVTWVLGIILFILILFASVEQS